MNDSQEREIFLPMLEKYLGAPAPVIKLQSAEEFSLDLFTLFKVVQSLGGFRACTEAEFWPIVAECLISEEALPNRTDAEDWADIFAQIYRNVLLSFELHYGSCFAPENGTSTFVQDGICTS
mmetsp:Transcript_26927/g.43954  ORF Transcript_26927/g.43954 Transcript_26927/m.43954 type:complete len:122 (+) Transcript_26927:223-588(+)